jgi:hypothetical protein
MYALLVLATVLIFVLPAAAVSATERDDLSELKNFGGEGIDEFVSVTAAPGGFVAVGYAFMESFGNGDWTGVKRKGIIDAVIVRYDTNGNVRWCRNFGGTGSDYFTSVTTASDGFVAVGYSFSDSFGSGDWTGVKRKGITDATIVKYNNDGRVAWKKNFGGSDVNVFTSVAAVSDGFIAVGYSFSRSFGNGDWAGVTGNGGNEAIIVKYNKSGNMVWKKNFGGLGDDYFFSVSTSSDGNGFVVAGCSSHLSFGSGDWTGIRGKGQTDATIVEFDKNGDVIWSGNFGGPGHSIYYSVTAVSDGAVAAGCSSMHSFDNNGWTNIKGKDTNAIIVKHNIDGMSVWDNSFGGPSADAYYSLTASSDGFVAVGYSASESFGGGDWAHFEGKGDCDGIIVRYNTDGNVGWKRNIGGGGVNVLFSVAAVSGGFVVAGSSNSSSFGSGDWEGNEGKGSADALIFRYFAFVPVKNIINLPFSAVAGRTLTLTGTVTPSDSTDNTILWTVIDAGMTGATIDGNKLFTTGPGIVVVEAAVADGIEWGTPYKRSFTITVTETKVFSSDEGSDTLLWAGVILLLFAACAGLFILYGKKALLPGKKE